MQASVLSVRFGTRGKLRPVLAVWTKHSNTWLCLRQHTPASACEQLRAHMKEGKVRASVQAIGHRLMHTGNAGYVSVRVLAAAKLLAGQSRESAPQRRQLSVLEHGHWKAAGLPAPP